MPKHYVTFGQIHAHKVNNKLLHSNVVAVFDAKNSNEGRQMAFQMFGSKFSFDYHGEQFDQDSMKHFPGGFVEL